MLIKSISLWEPWSSLIATGAKRFETRSWGSNFRGPILICAAKTKVDYITGQHLADYLFDGQFQGGLAPLVGKPLRFFEANTTYDAGVRPEHLGYGNAVAIAMMTGCIPTYKLTPEMIGTDLPFGDFGRDRFAWKLEHATRIPFPMPVRGKQMLFDVYVQDTQQERFLLGYIEQHKDIVAGYVKA